MKLNWKILLGIGGVCSTIVGLLHIVIVYYGAPAYRFFGAGEEMAVMSEKGSMLPAVVTLIIALVFILWGLYAFSGVGLIRRLPKLRLGLVIIGSIYTLRGVLIFFQIFEITVLNESLVINDLVFSIVSLFIGIVYLAGMRIGWQMLKTQLSQPA